MEAMKIDLSEDELNLVVEALEHLYAYTRAARRDDARYRELADRLKMRGAVETTRSRLSRRKSANIRKNCCCC
jgi:hypothetical protein